MKSISEQELAEIKKRNPELIIVDDLDRVPRTVAQIDLIKASMVSEQEIHIAVMKECDRRSVNSPAWNFIFHPANGELRNPIVAKILKGMGVKSGVPDLIWPLARFGFNGMALELKREGGKVSENQKKWLDFFKEQNWYRAVAYSYDEAIYELRMYIGEP